MQIYKLNLTEEIYKVYEDREKAEPKRKHALGASNIGAPCDRAIWYSFRMCKDVEFDGRILRLFRRGKDAEPQFIEELTEAGYEVLAYDTNGEQFRRTSCDGHFSANIDGLIRFADQWFVLEFKTHNDKSFGLLQSKGVWGSKPQHHAQCIVGAGLMDLGGTVYIAENKNTSGVWAEFVPFDVDEMKHYWERAKRIIEANSAPERINDRPDYYLCKMCDFADLCHDQQASSVNCCTCCHSTPVADGAWACTLANDAIPGDVLLEGCPEHIYLPSLLPWEPVDGENEYVVYENGVSNVAASGFLPLGGESPPALFTSEELFNVGNLRNIKEVCEVKQKFGGKVVKGGEVVATEA
jgi:hypothetical protein